MTNLKLVTKQEAERNEDLGTYAGCTETKKFKFLGFEYTYVKSYGTLWDEDKEEPVCNCPRCDWRDR